MKNFMVKNLIASLALAGVITLITDGSKSRAPASAPKAMELQLQSIAFPAGSKIHDMDHLVIRATFARDNVVELFRAQPLNLASGETRALDSKIDIDPKWLVNNELEMKLELVHTGGLMEVVVARCAQVSKEVLDYNRGLQCTLPGDQAPVLSYRLGEKGSTPNKAVVAQNN